MRRRWVVGNALGWALFGVAFVHFFYELARTTESYMHAVML
jgi:hypothetical protein